MITRTALPALAALVVLGPLSCGKPDSGRSSAPATVPPGCDLSGARVEWSGHTTQPTLTRVYLDSGKGVSETSTVVLDEPFTPAVTGVAAPADWLPRLARSLSAETGDEIHVESPVQKDGRIGFGGQVDDPTIRETLSYQGVQAVSADFSVSCEQPVRGTLTAWTSMSVGGVTCSQIEPPAEELGRLARRYCPRTPTPGPPSEAVPFD
ncbi:hypothetical protein AB0M36_11985 [Actinoplanes sp. NPDC051346]|uniref:hypothetical protein n=1 Tax=Actinoplanes sp. NPDC051346 TaxID=3155048 RepID=UPI0034208A2F